MPSLPDSSFKLQKSLTKRKLVSKSWTGQDFMLVQEVWSPGTSKSQTFWSTGENACFLSNASHLRWNSLLENSKCFSANRLRNGEDTDVNKALLLTPVPSLTSPNLKSTYHPLPSRAGDDKTRTDVLFPPAQALINNLQVLIFEPFTEAHCDPESPSPLSWVSWVPSFFSFTLPCTYC